MKIKHFNWLLITLLLVAVLVGAACVYFKVDSYGAPKYEVVDLDLTFPYEFTTSEGQKIQSFYVVALHKGKPVPYDPKYGNVGSFNESYLNEIESITPKSKYNFLQRHIGVFALLSAALAFIVLFFIAWIIRDVLLMCYVAIFRKFTDSTYFLSDYRWVGKDVAKKVFSESVDSFVKKKNVEITNQYPQSANFIIGLLKHIQAHGSPLIIYTLKYENLVEPHQKTYIDRIIRYWEQRIATDDNAKSNLDYLRELKEKDYIDICVLTKIDAIESAVTSELNSFFEKLMGDRVFSFDTSRVKKLIYGTRLNVSIVIANSVQKTFTWSGMGYSGKTFPGIDIRFSISGPDGNILWDKWLKPVCSYSSTDESFTVSDLYDSMVRQTIGSFSSQF